MEIKFLGEPVSTNTIYRYSCFAGHLHAYISKEGKAMKESYAWQFKAKKAKGWKMDSQYEVEVRLFFKNKRPHDVDNYNKLLLDAATGIIWDDDKQIVKLTITKGIDKENPRVETVVHSI